MDVLILESLSDLKIETNDFLFAQKGDSKASFYNDWRP